LNNIRTGAATHLSRNAELALEKDSPVDFVHANPETVINLSEAIAPITAAFVAAPGNTAPPRSHTAAIRIGLELGAPPVDPAAIVSGSFVMDCTRVDILADAESDPFPNMYIFSSRSKNTIM
jgi:hypothetical protein